MRFRSSVCSAEGSAPALGVQAEQHRLMSTRMAAAVLMGVIRMLTDPFNIPYQLRGAFVPCVAFGEVPVSGGGVRMGIRLKNLFYLLNELRRSSGDGYEVGIQPAH